MTRVAKARFALTGAAGFVAPRHLKAMVDTQSTLVAACDPHDSVGVLDSYFFDAHYFREFERFDRHLEKQRREGKGIDYLSICSPNYLHDAHIRFALRMGAHAICEKPLVINPWNIEPLEDLASEMGKKIYPILQLREHESIKSLKEYVEGNPEANFDVELSYITSRGPWYLNSWKGKNEQSGGLSSNIGVHFFDALLWIFGELNYCELHLSTERTLSGYLELERARVRWFLSIDRDQLPSSSRAAGQSTYRSLRIDGQKWEFSTGFSDLHTKVYRSILSGQGVPVAEARPAIELTHLLRQAETKTASSRCAHSFLQGRPA